MEARESSATKVWRQYNLEKLCPKFQLHIKEEKTLEGMIKNWKKLFGPRAQPLAPCTLLLLKCWFSIYLMHLAPTEREKSAFYLFWAPCMFCAHFYLFKVPFHPEVFIQQFGSSKEKEGYRSFNDGSLQTSLPLVLVFVPFFWHLIMYSVTMNS